MKEQIGLKVLLPWGTLLTICKNGENREKVGKVNKLTRFFFKNSKLSGHIAKDKRQVIFERNPHNEFRENCDMDNRRTGEGQRTNLDFMSSELKLILILILKFI